MRAPAVLRSGAKRALRLYGMATAGSRDLPRFLIIGAKRGGTTSLYHYLRQHPQVPPLFPARQNIKGTYFFDLHHGRGERWYRSHFPARGRSRVPEEWVAGEASPYYLFHPLAAERAAASVPDAKIVVLLRDPVERAYSHFRERVRHGAEHLSFEEAIEQEPARLDGEEARLARDDGYRSDAHQHLSYVAQGRYAVPLGRWLDRFPREQVLVVLSERFYEEPLLILRRVQRFLGLVPRDPRELPRLNYHPGAAMSPATRARLRELFAESNERLGELVDVDIGAWGVVPR